MKQKCKHACLTVLLAACSVLAQQTAEDTGKAAEPWSCRTIALTADSPSLPYPLFAPYLEKQGDFRASAMQLSDQSLAADVFVHLSEEGIGSTRIVVVNRRTHESRVTSSSWTEYPSLVATDVMNEVSLVCRGPAVLVARETPVVRSTTEAQIGNSTIETGHGFKHFMGRTAYYAGQGLAAAAIVAGYVAYGIAISAPAD
jgi:hypothetical protein